MRRPRRPRRTRCASASGLPLEITAVPLSLSLSLYNRMAVPLSAASASDADGHRLYRQPIVAASASDAAAVQKSGGDTDRRGGAQPPCLYVCARDRAGAAAAHSMEGTGGAQPPFPLAAQRRQAKGDLSTTISQRRCHATGA
jgi:hypothetical protein